MVDAARASVLGVECFAGSLDDAASATIARALGGGGGYACLCSVHGVVFAHHEPELRDALDRAWRVFPDGFPVAWMARRTGALRATRIAGTELMARVFELGQDAGLRHHLYGSTPEVLELLRRRLLERFPRALVVGALSPSFAPLDEGEAARDLELIRATEPHVVWIGISTPKQDLWMARYAARLAPALALGVGAAFDFNAGTKKRAPVWMQRTSLEWLHRLASEPRRLTGRYARIVAEFSLRAAVDLVRRRGAA